MQETEDAMICYSATHDQTGKKYIGISDRELKARKLEHECHSKNGTFNTTFHQALRKHGKDSFTWKILADGEPEIIKILERVLVGEWRTYHPNGYNSTHEYSEGAPTTEELNFFEAMDTNLQDMEMIYDLQKILDEANKNPLLNEKTKKLIRPLIDHLKSGDCTQSG